LEKKELEYLTNETSKFSNELAYFLGLMTGRGNIFQSKSNPRIIIEFAHHNPLQTGIPFCPDCNGIVNTKTEKCKKCGKITKAEYKITFDQRKEVLTSIEKEVVPLIKKFVKTEIDVTGTNTYTIISVDFSRDHQLFEWIKSQFFPFTSFHSFEIPKIFTEVSETLKIEFVRGIADTAGFPVWGNWHQSGLARTYIQIINANWKLPVQICNFLQSELNIPIQTIDWGHPNIRDGNMMEFKAGKSNSSFREHQIKIYADNFAKISHRLNHKKLLFEELSLYNNSINVSHSSECEPPKKIQNGKFRIKHDAENSDKLPDELRNKHFDAYWQICWQLGCKKCEEFSQISKDQEYSYLTGKKDPDRTLNEEIENIKSSRIKKTNELESKWSKLKTATRLNVKKNTSNKITEHDTYEPQKKWLKKFLEKKFPDSKIETHVIADVEMNSYFANLPNTEISDLVQNFDIRPDVVGIIDEKYLAFIESKITSLGIKEIGQLLGYCLISNPKIAILCSTIDSTVKISKLITNSSLIKYGTQQIHCAVWDQKLETMNFITGEHDG
tara:strand:+ start:86 stop:1750 length:1665 start_codon:yes stop_codon:yes gene_type:complete